MPKLAILVTASILGLSGGKVPAPPVKYQADNTVKVEFMSPRDVTKKCQSLNGDKGAKACASVELMTLPFACGQGEYAQLICDALGDKNGTITFGTTVPNPCKYQGTYAGTVCHELGHVNGWPPTHPKR